MEDVNELLKRMPKNYRELNWKIWLEITNNVLVEQPSDMEEDDFRAYQAYSMISIMLNIPISELEKASYLTMIPLINSLGFLNVGIPHVNCSLAVKDSNELTYKEFQSLIILVQDQWVNMSDILEIILVDKSKEEIENLSIYDVQQVFFFLTANYKKSLNHSRKSLAIQLIKMSLKEKMKKMFRLQESI